jgi:hypothetical protein
MTEAIATIIAVGLVDSAKVLAGGYIIGKIIEGLLSE